MIGGGVAIVTVSVVVVDWIVLLDVKNVGLGIEAEGLLSRNSLENRSFTNDL
jgi:hypothetical protein